MQIRRDDEYTQQLLDTLVKSYERSERTGIHISDIVYCLRKAYFRRHNTSKIDEEQALHFVRGNSLHSALWRLYSAREVMCIYDGVIGTIDALTDDLVVEFKTTKRLYSGKAYDHHVRQLSYYMAMINRHVGYVVYLDLADNELISFRVELDNNDIGRLRREISERRELLEAALLGDDPALLPTTTERWECKYCEYTEQCRATEAGTGARRS